MFYVNKILYDISYKEENGLEKRNIHSVTQILNTNEQKLPGFLLYRNKSINLSFYISVAE